jgi:Na+-driven multidrug efflux pump
MAGRIVKGLLQPPREGEETRQAPLTYPEIIHFYLPLALTSFLALGTQPLVTFFVAHGRMAIDSLAVLPVIFGLVFIFMSFGLSFHEASIALLGERQRHFKELRNFAFGLGSVTVGLLGLISFTPLSTLWFHNVSGLSLVLTHLSLLPLKIVTLLPGIWVLLTFQRSVLVNARQTRPITWATGLELLLIVITLLITIRYFDMVGVVGAALALMIGRTGANLYLLHPFFKALKKSQ